MLERTREEMTESRAEQVISYVVGEKLSSVAEGSEMK